VLLPKGGVSISNISIQKISSKKTLTLGQQPWAFECVGGSSICAPAH
jgi:hypothetical protein